MKNDDMGVDSLRSGALGELVCELLLTRFAGPESFYFPVGRADWGLDGILRLEWGEAKKFCFLIGIQSKCEQKKSAAFSIKGAQLAWLKRFPGPLLLIGTYRPKDKPESIGVWFSDYSKALKKVRGNTVRCFPTDPLHTTSWATLPHLDLNKEVFTPLLEPWYDKYMDDSLKEFEEALRGNDRPLANRVLKETIKGTKDPQRSVLRARFFRVRDRNANSALGVLNRFKTPGLLPLKDCSDRVRSCPHYELAVSEHEAALVKLGKTQNSKSVACKRIHGAIAIARTALMSHSELGHRTVRARLAMVGLGFACDALFIDGSMTLDKTALKEFFEAAIPKPNVLVPYNYTFQLSLYQHTLKKLKYLPSKSSIQEGPVPRTPAHLALRSLHKAFDHDEDEERRHFEARLALEVFKEHKHPRSAISELAVFLTMPKPGDGS